jgi:drug/metabolite transporter (DMT)-like permease
MTAVLAISSALLIGCADFLGGVISRGASAVRVVALAQLAGLVLGLPASVVVDWERITPGDVAWSLAAGVSVGIGLVLFYTAMARGMISLVAPVTAVIGATIPVLYALGHGERPGKVAVGGIVLAIAAIALVSLAPRHRDAANDDGARTLTLAIGAGVLFGLFYVGLSRTSDDAGLWPFSISRAASAGALLALALATTRGVSIGRGFGWQIALIAVLEVGAGVAVLLALHRGPVSVASVLASLYPVTTTCLAALVLRERLRGLQLIGVALALVAVALISSA